MDDDEFSRREQQIARDRIKQWTIEDRRALLALPVEETRVIGLATALLDLRPVDHIEDGGCAVEVDLR